MIGLDRAFQSSFISCGIIAEEELLIKERTIHMTEFLTVDPQEIFDDVISRGREAGVADQEAYNELCDDVVTERLEVGEMDEDGPTIMLVGQLKNRWPDYQEALGLGAEQPQL